MFFIPGHAFYKKGLQKQISIGTIVSSQERRGLFVLVKTGGQLRVLFCRLPDMHCMRRVYNDKAVLVHWSAARNEERLSSR